MDSSFKGERFGVETICLYIFDANSTDRVAVDAEKAFLAVKIHMANLTDKTV